MTIASSTRNPHPGGSSAGMAQPDAYAIPAISRGPLKLKTTATERAKAIHAKEARRLEKLDAKLARANGLPGSDHGGKRQTSTGENPDRKAFRAESSRMARQRHSDGVYGYDPARIQSDTLCGGAMGDWRMNSDGEEDFVVLGHVKPPSSRSTPSPMKRQRTSDHVNHTMRAGEHIRIIDSDDDVKVDATSDHAHIAPLPGADIEINAARLPRPRNGATNDEATIPKRHRPHRTAQARSGIDASTIPDPSAFTNGRGQLDDDAYLAAIRAGHNRTLLQREAEQRRLDQISSSHRRAEQERIAEAAREQENKKRHQRRKAEKARKAEEARRRAEEAQEKEREEGQAAVRWKEARRKVYLDKWATVYGAKSTVDGEMAGAWSFGQVPWPVYPLRTADGLSTKPVTLESLIPTGIRSFLLDMASTHGPGTATSDADSLSWKKVLTKAIQHMHPDRATTRLLPRVRSADRDAVKEGIEVCARILNALKDE